MFQVLFHGGLNTCRRRIHKEVLFPHGGDEEFGKEEQLSWVWIE
jgi:hypothetical protein